MDRQTTDPPEPTDGDIYRFRSSSQFKISAYQIQSIKRPLENRVWYEHEGETTQNGVGPTGRPSKIGRVLDDGSSQVYRYEYNSRGNITRFTDPIGRETVFEYATNDIDLLGRKQKNGANYDLFEEITYNSGHQPLTIKDAAGQTTTYTYNGQGQLLTLTMPPRAGITENRTTAYDYDDDGYLESVTGPASGATASYTYDSYGRTRTATDSDGYTLTYDYDALGRRTRTTFPDTTFTETIYERLHPSRSRDRLGRWTQRLYDALRRLTATTDPLGRTVTQHWCTCGSLEAIVDANGNGTRWERDIQGRVTREIRANESDWLYEYEQTTSRLKAITDAKDQVKTLTYALDGQLQNIAYTNEEHETPNVTLTYDSAWDRVSTMVDGTGTTTYSYYRIGANPTLLGAGQVATVDGPLGSDTTSYAYDETGRVTSRAINGATVTYHYDALGRITSETSAVGTFTHQYDGVTSRLKTVTYPNGQASTYSYHPNSGDHRLQEILHKKPGGAPLWKFSYTYDAAGNIETWTQQQDEESANAYDFDFDRAGQLRSAVWRTTDETPTILKRYAYIYDPTGNRTVEQIDDVPVLSAYDGMNRLTNQTPGGTMRFAGSLNEAATVTIEGQPATVTGDNRFERGVEVSSGTNQVIVKAKDYSGNERANTYEVSISGSSKTFTYDANGNLTSDGTRTLEWDAENRLVRVVIGVEEVVSFSYDGEGRRSSRTSGGVTQTFVYDGDDVIQERNGTTITKTYQYGPGLDRPLVVQGLSDTLFFVADHLGSVVAVTDESGDVVLTRTYDPFGKLTSGASAEGFSYTGREWEPDTGLFYYRARFYDASLGRFISEDPTRFAADTNLYRYVLNNPLVYNDPFGWAAAAVVCCDGKGGFTTCIKQGGLSGILETCVNEHEEDHAKWLREHCPDQCKGKPAKYDQFQMTPEQQKEFECRGYKAEVDCLKRPPMKDPQVTMKRIRDLKAAQKNKKFDCDTSSW